MFVLVQPLVLAQKMKNKIDNKIFNITVNSSDCLAGFTFESFFQLGRFHGYFTKLSA
jgi:hypothetical protein